MDISLPKRHIDSDWLTINDKRIKVDYPKGKQIHKLQDLQLKMIGNGDKLEYSVFVEYARTYLKYTIKDWEGFSLPCKLVNDELEDSLWYDLTSDIERTQFLFEKIEEVLRWNDVEKKS